jgi:hypothetical protein
MSKLQTRLRGESDIHFRFREAKLEEPVYAACLFSAYSLPSGDSIAKSLALFEDITRTIYRVN